MSSRCPACGSTYEDDVNFCPKDGSRLVSRTARPADAPTPAPGATPQGYDGRTGTLPPPRPGAAIAAGAAGAAGAGGATPSGPMALVGTTLEGRYRIEGKLGEGGMSIVFLAIDETTDALLAIKVLSPTLSRDENAMARLRREASMGARLSHPNVCPILRMGETADGLVFVVMPFVDGELLVERTNRLRQLPLPEVVRYVRDIAEGLDAAHRLGIVHRDLKPENVMLSPDAEGVERAVVLDFGLAKERRAGRELEKLTATGIVVGTPEFMSPEQLRGKSIDGRTDVYALALMTYEMLTGALPFRAKTQQESMIARLKSDPIPLRAMRPELDLPEGVDRVIQVALSRDPRDRQQSAPAFASALAAAVAGEAGDQSSDSGRGFLKKILRRQ